MDKLLNRWRQHRAEELLKEESYYKDDLKLGKWHASDYKDVKRSPGTSCAPEEIERRRKRYRTMVDTIATGKNPFRFQLSREINPAFECMSREFYDEICQYAKSKGVEIECWTGVPVEEPEDLMPGVEPPPGARFSKRDFIDRHNPFIKDQKTRDYYFKPETPDSQPKIEVILQRVQKMMDYHNRSNSSAKNRQDKAYHFGKYKKFFKTYQQIKAAQAGKSLGKHVRSWYYKDKARKKEDSYKPSWETGYKPPEQKEKADTSNSVVLGILSSPSKKRRAKRLTMHWLNTYKISLEDLQKKIGVEDDGYWGNNTLEALIKAQVEGSESPRDWDGIAGPKTLKMLGLR